MNRITLISDSELLSIMPELVLREQTCTAEVIEHLVEIDRRKLYVEQACGSLTAYCIERLGYSEDEACKRARVARLASRFPSLLDELSTGAVHLTGLLLISNYLSEENYAELVGESRHKTKREIEQLIAARFPKPDLPGRMCPIPAQTANPALIRSGADPVSNIPPEGVAPGTAHPMGAKLLPLSPARWSVQFTATAEFHDKIARAQELLSHALPSGDLAALFERALDELIDRETKRRLGAGKPRRRRPLSPGSRHIPVEIARQVWERDGGQCTFVDEHGRRCSARRLVQLEHRNPYALGGPPTAENLCLLCAAHNAHVARKVFGAAHMERKQAERQGGRGSQPESDEALQRVHGALCRMGFQDREARRAIRELSRMDVGRDLESLIRAAFGLLVPA